MGPAKAVNLAGRGPRPRRPFAHEQIIADALVDVASELRLADAAELAEKIDTSRARVALDRAKANMPGANATEEDWDAANAAISRATVRLEAATKGGSGATATASREMEHTKA